MGQVLEVRGNQSHEKQFRYSRLTKVHDKIISWPAYSRMAFTVKVVGDNEVVVTAADL